MDELLRLKEANKDLKSRLAKLSEASLLITRSLDPKDILQGVADGACLLTDARYGALLVFDDAGNIENLSISGLSDEEIEAVGVLPEGQGILGYLNELEGPLRLTNVDEHPRSSGVPENHPPLDTFLGMVISHLDRKVGTIYLCESGRASSPRKTRKSWLCSPPRPPWPSPTPSTTAVSSIPGPTWKRWWTCRRWASWCSTPRP